MSEVILKGRGVTKKFGGLVAVNSVDFDVYEGEIFGIIGPNGAGKTTLMNLIVGLLPLSDGEIYFRNVRISGKKPYYIARLGIARTFQIVKPFKGMTVLENIMVGAFFGHGNYTSYKEAYERAEEIANLVGLWEKRDELVDHLNLAQLKRIELARALALEPEVLLLDEVMAGLNPTEMEKIMDLVRDINKKGVTVIMIEHIMKAVMGLSSRMMVLHFGTKIAEGTPEEISQNEDVIKAYLGERYSKRRKSA